MSIGFFKSLRFIAYLNPWNWQRRKHISRGEALRKTLEELGPIFIKFGQALSTRPDILAHDIAIELAKLQDKVKPFSKDLALSIISDAYGRSAFEIFANFDSTPLACASMAQVHAATLINGADVVVKILRPNMHKIIKQDLKLLNSIARLADRYWKDAKRFKPIAIVREFERILLDELDFKREAANANQLRRNFKNSPLLYIPMIHWDYICDNILVMERIYGIPVNDINTLKEYKINLKILAERGLEIFFTQVFRDRFFHADMHPGNIFVAPSHPENPQYICVDFGIIGTLSTRDMRYIAENLLAFFKCDYRKVAQLHIESGWVAVDTCMEDFESAIRTVCEPMIEKSLKDISFATVLLHLLQVARRFNMAAQPQLVLLQKTLFAIEGLGRQLYPELNLWDTAKPFLERWMRQQIGISTLIKNVRANIPFIVEELPHLPRLLHEILILNKTQCHTPEQKYTPNYRDINTGVLITALSFAAINYSSHEPKLTVLSLIIAAIAGTINLKRCKQSATTN